MSRTGWRSLTFLLVAAGAAAALALTAYRLQFGVGFQDESTYVAEPMRFALGDRFFVDDLDVRQTSAWLLVPVVSLYLAATGGSEGIVLVVRVLYLVFALGIAGVVYGVLRGRLPWIAALFTALICAVYAPFNIFSLSYNTMGSHFLVAGVLLGVAGVEHERRRSVQLALSGLAWALACISYPTFVGAAVGFAALLAWRLPRPRLRGMIAWALGAALLGAPLAAMILRAGFAALRDTLAFTGAWGTLYGSEHFGGAAKLLTIRHQLPELEPSIAFGVLLSVLLVFGARRVPALAVAGAPLLALAPFLFSASDNVAGMRFVIVFGLLAPIFAFSLREQSFVRTLFVLGWIPALAAGITAAWSSTNGLMNLAIGFLPACLISSVLIVLWASERAAASHARGLRSAALLTPVVAVAGLVYSQFAGFAVYRDAPIAALQSRVSTGPFRGIRTVESRALLLESLGADLPSVVNSNGRILFYPHFAAGFLMTSMRPATPYTWVGGVYGLHARWMAERGGPDVIVRLRPVGDDLEQLSFLSPGIARLDEAVLPGLRLAIERPEYQIYTRAP